MSESAIRITGLGKEYRIGARAEPYDTLRESLMRALRGPLDRIRGCSTQREKRFWALKDINLTVGRGEIVGVIGRNGAGKSTLLKILSRITAPSRGQVELTGRVGSLLEVGTGFHPELSGRENIFLNGAILGMRRAEVTSKLDDIIAFAEIDEFLETPIKRYSSGMHVRLAFAVAAHLHPEILLVDEVLAVGDAAFQRKCLSKVDEVAHDGRTVIFVSHQMSQIRRLCKRVVWLRDGRLEADGEASEIINQYEFDISEQAGSTTRTGDCFIRWSFADGGNVLPHPQDRVTLWIEVNAPERVVAGHFGAVVSDDEGRIVAGWAFDDLNLPEGPSRLSLELDGLPIKPGTYALLFSLFTRGNNLNGGKALEIWHAVPRLIVNSQDFGHPQSRWSGPLNVKASLTHSR